MIRLIRKIVKILRGGAGSKEIFLGILSGVLIGMVPGVNLTLLVAIWLMLLLNANITFVLLGLAVGKISCLLLAPVTFHLGYLLVHNIGLEELFRFFRNTPVLALMDFDVYCLVGGIPIAVILGTLFGKMTASFITKIRQQMVKAGSNQKLHKVGENKLFKIFMRIAFGKQKLSTQDVLDKHSPFLRKSGIILTGVVIALTILTEFFLLDYILKSSVTSGISTATGAEVNLEDATLSLSDGKLELKGLQVTNPDKPTHNMMQIENLVADISMSEILRKSYAIDLLKGDDMKLDEQREKPGKIFKKETPEEKTPAEKKVETGEEKNLEDYIEQAKSCKKYLAKLKRYLDKRKQNAEDIEKGKKPKQDKEATVESAKELGYLKARAENLVTDRPDWTIRKLEIDNMSISKDYQKQKVVATELSSHPELNKEKTTITITPTNRETPMAKVTLRFDDPKSNHELLLDFQGLPLSKDIKMSGKIPMDIKDGKIDAKVSGEFSGSELNLPFTIMVRDLKADVEEGKTIMGMDHATAKEVFSTLEQIELVGTLKGSLLLPKVSIDYDRLLGSLKEALIKAGKKALADKANAEMDKAKAVLKEKADEELDKLKDKVGSEAKKALGDALKGFSSDSKENKDEEDKEEKPTDLLKKLF